MDHLDKIGQRSIFTCPLRRGPSLLRLRCHTGHMLTAHALAPRQSVIVEDAIWAAIRALHEKEALPGRFAKNAAAMTGDDAAAKHMAAAKQPAHHAEILRWQMFKADNAISHIAGRTLGRMTQTPI